MDRDRTYGIARRGNRLRASNYTVWELNGARAIRKKSEPSSFDSDYKVSVNNNRILIQARSFTIGLRNGLTINGVSAKKCAE